MSDNAQPPVELESHPQGVVLAIRAHPKAKKNAITGVHDGRLKVSVTQAPEKGKANDAIVQLLAKSLGLKRSQITIHAGATSQQKAVLLEGVSAGEIWQRIEAARP